MSTPTDPQAFDEPGRVSDEDLVLLLYGEMEADEARRLGERIDRDADLQRRYEALAAILDLVDESWPVPEPPVGWEATQWRRLAPRLAPRTSFRRFRLWLRKLFAPGARLEGRPFSPRGAVIATAVSAAALAVSLVAVGCAVLQAYLVAGAEEPLMAAAQNEADPKLRDRAIQLLGALGAHSALDRLYEGASSREAKVQVIKAMGVAGDADGLLQAARHETDPKLRAAAVHSLGVGGSAEALEQLYREEPELRFDVLQGLFIQGAASTLVELFREERNPQLKREIVRRLTLMDSPEATELLMEILDR